jgi:hypothetical protein
VLILDPQLGLGKILQLILSAPHTSRDALRNSDSGPYEVTIETDRANALVLAEAAQPQSSTITAWNVAAKKVGWGQAE